MTDDSTAAGLTRGVRIEVLGPPRILVDGTVVDLGGTKPRLLIATLVAAGGREVSTERLIDSLWVDEPPASARKAVQVYVSNIRRKLGGSEALKTSPSGYVLQTTGVEVDADDFQRSVEAATRLLRTDPAAASRGLSDALASWAGAAYGDLATEPCVEAEAVRLEALRIVAIERRVDADLRLGRHAELVGELDSLTREHPYREQLRAAHMLALYRSGRQADALRAFTRTRALLVDELGVEPSPDLRRLHQQILEHAAELALDHDESPATRRRALLVTDIADSTAHWEHDPDAMGRALARHDEILSDAVESEGGRVFKHTGDGMLAVFDTVPRAAAAGVRAQVALLDEHWPTASPLRVRMAVDDGPVEERADDFFGPALNRVMRVMAAGHGGQLLVSSFAVTGLDQPVRSLGDADLHGIGRIEVYQIVAQGLDDDHPELRTGRTPPAISRSAFGQAIRGYELREELGSGAFGVVYRAYQSAVGREVAIKLVRPERANDPSFVRRFEAEAQFVAQLEHPHIVSLYDYWRDPDGAFLVMPLLKAGSVAQALERGQLNSSAAIRLVEQVGSALAYAHRHGVLHRDIKPANVLLDDDGNAYLGDFGIASDHLMAVGDARATTVAYLAPEELAGTGFDARADLYCLGVLAHEILTGRRPALGEQPESTHALRPDVPVGFDDVIARATALDPEQRYQRAEEFVRAVRRALGADVVSPTKDRPAGSIRNPFKGLRAFSEVDAADFFGRDALIDELIETIRARRVTVAIGPSGIGKSSVVRAGVLPAVRAGALGPNWLIADMFPGTYPFEELEAALLRVAVDRPDSMLAELESDDRGLLRVSKQILPDDDSSLLLVIDQFEELFSLVADESVRSRFLASLVAVAQDERSRVSVLVTMRADFFDRPLRYPEFGELVRDGLVPVTMPSNDSIALAISRPAQNVGLELEPGLVGAIVHDVAHQPGGLPLLQHAMSELFDGRDGNVVTAESYREAGGVTGALARRAEEIYSGLTESGRASTKDVFLRLVNVSEDSEDTRRRVRRSELASMASAASAIDSAVEAYGSFRLLSFDHDPVTRGPTVEVAHEALLREWPRLRGWIDEHRDDLLHGRRLSEASAEWESHGRDPSFLLRGSRLDEVRAWSAGTELRFTEVEQWFLDASISAAEDEDREAAARAERDRRLRRRSRLLVGSVAGVVVLALLAAIALVNRNRADSERARAEGLAVEAVESRDVADSERARAEELAAALSGSERAQRLASQANVLLESDPKLAVGLAVEAARTTAELGYVTPVAADSLQWALRADRAVFPADEDTPVALRPSPSGMTGAFMVPIGELIEFAQDGHVRRLSPRECEQFFPGDDCPDPAVPFPPVELDGGDERYREYTDPQRPLAGSKVVVLGNTASNADTARHEEVYGRAVADSGVDIDLLEFDGLLQRVERAPETDLILSPQPGTLDALAERRRIVDISSLLDGGELQSRFGDGLFGLMQLRQGGPDSVFSVPVNLDNKSLVYYNRAVFDTGGYEFPDSWEGLLTLSEQMVIDGVTPWCFASNSQETSAWTKTDWVELMLLRTAGPDVYDAWWSGSLPFSSPEVRAAFETVGELVFPPGFTAGGAASVPFGSYWGSWSQLGSESPPCAMQIGPNWALSHTFVPAAAEAAYGVAPMPPIDPRFGKALLGAGNFLAVAQDSPEARAVLAAALSTDFYDIQSEVWRAYIAPDPAYGVSDVASPLQREIVDVTHDALRAGAFRFDGSDLMPATVSGGAFLFEPERWFVSGPDALDGVLAAIDAAWPGRATGGLSSVPDAFLTEVAPGRHLLDQFEPSMAIDLSGRLFVGQNVPDEISFGESFEGRGFGAFRVAGYKTREESAQEAPNIGSIPVDGLDTFIEEHRLSVSDDRRVVVDGRPARLLEWRTDPDDDRGTSFCEPARRPCFWGVRHPDGFARERPMSMSLFTGGGTTRVWIFDEHGPEPLWFVAFAPDGDEVWLDRAGEMVESIEFVPSS